MVSARRPRVRRRRSVPSAQHTPDCLTGPRRSNSSACLVSNYGGSNSGASTTSSCVQLSPSFRCLEQISLNLEAEEEKSTNNPTKTQAVFYVLHVRHAECDVVWSRRLDLSEYLGFQLQLLQILKQGHVCPGDCPWLYSFVKGYFPKGSSCPFKLFCPKMIAKRREALAHCLTVMHGFLLTRENQSCAVLHGSVLKAFTAFVYGELGPSHPLLSKMKVDEQLVAEDAVSTAKDDSCASLTDSNSSWSSASSSSTVSSSSSGTASSASTDASSTTAPACPLCHNRLDEDAASFSEFVPPTLPVLPVPSSSASSSSSRRASRLYYATTLRCGHEFHEECVLQWLNQALSCPVCGHSEIS